LPFALWLRHRERFDAEPLVEFLEDTIGVSHSCEGKR
jgi:hypothetical protein